MISRRSLTASLAGFTAGCGGGAVATAPSSTCRELALFSSWGDSIASGGYTPSPGSLHTAYLRPRPVARMVEKLDGRALGIDRAVPGSTVAQYLEGWESTVEMDPAKVQVFRFGGADALVLTPPEEVESALVHMAGISQRRGKSVVVSGLPHLARKPAWQSGVSDEHFARIVSNAAGVHSATKHVADRLGLLWVDIRALRFDGPSDIADGFHLAQGYSDRCADALAVAVSSRLP